MYTITISANTHTHKILLYVVINQVRADGGAKQKRRSTHILYSPVVSFTLTHTNTHSYTLSRTRFRWFRGEVSWLPFYWWFPSNMKHFFSHLTTHTCTASGLSFRTYTDSQKQGVGVSSTRPASRVRSCTELHTYTFTHLSWIFMVCCTLHLALL